MSRNIILEHPIIHDKYTAAAEQMFDVPHLDQSSTVIVDNIEPPAEWNIGLIYGPSGSGKSTLLRKFGYPEDFEWDMKKSVISQFQKLNPEEAVALLSAVGLNTVPTWLRSYHCLSNGERFRCDMAQSIVSDNDTIVIDEFTSVVDRNVAKSASNAIQKYIRKHNKKVVLASCHADIIDFLQPDWVYNPTEALTHVLPRGSLQRPQIPLKVFRAKYEAWELFKHAHYLSADLNKAARVFMATWNDVPVGVVAILAMPNPYKKNCWRESRTVILPDFQGLGLGVRLSDYFGAMVKAQGGIFYSKTIHPAMIAYRLKSGKWKETSHSRESRVQTAAMDAKDWVVSNRFCYAFEYIGEPTSVEESQLFWEKLDTKKRK